MSQEDETKAKRFQLPAGKYGDTCPEEELRAACGEISARYGLPFEKMSLVRTLLVEQVGYQLSRRVGKGDTMYVVVHPFENGRGHPVLSGTPLAALEAALCPQVGAGLEVLCFAGGLPELRAWLTLSNIPGHEGVATWRTSGPFGPRGHSVYALRRDENDALRISPGGGLH